jgi:hypothetical protein
MTGWGAGYSSVEHGIFQMSLGAAGTLRLPVGPAQSLLLRLEGNSSARFSSMSTIAPTTWRLGASFGYIATIRNLVTLSLALRADENVLYQGALPGASFDDKQLDLRLSLGSTQLLGLRPLPLIAIQVRPTLSLDVYAGVAFSPSTDTWSYSTMAGLTRTW